MHQQFDPYRVLGLPIGASKREIQKRYRQLLRTHHPDVSADPGRAHEFAAQIGRAYRMLADDGEREAYERDVFRIVDPDLEVVVEQADPDRSRVPRLIEQAQQFMEQRRYEEAQLACSEVLTLDPDCATAYELLGEAYRHQGKRDLSREMHQEAERLAGIGPAPYRHAHTRHTVAPSHDAPSQDQEHHDIWVPGPVRPLLLIDLAAVLLAAGLLALAAALGGPVTPLLGVPLSGFLLAVGAAFVMAMGLAASGRIRTFDQEVGLIVAVGAVSTPLWVLVLAASCLSGWLGALLHLIVMALSDALSGTSVGFWALVAVVSMAAFALLGADLIFLWLGVNALSVAALAGWAAGSILSPREWWR